MGCDGGTIPRRDELVKTKKKKELKDKDADLAAKWQYCALSSTRLQEPIVACELGRLYNKEALIEYLLNRNASTSEVASHIRSLKDVTTLRLTRKKTTKIESKSCQAGGSTTGGEYVDNQDSAFICPVVGLEMSGKYKFCFITECGCVVSERALKEVKSDTCHGCGRTYDPKEDAIIINGSPEEVEQLKISLNEKRAKVKADKKSKKRAKTTETSREPNEAVDSSQSCSETKKRKKDLPTPSSSSASGQINKGATSSSSSSSSASTTKTSATSLLPEKARSDYSVSKDPNASETYKSLFTTHSTATNKPKGPWVTYNPLYF